MPRTSSARYWIRLTAILVLTALTSVFWLGCADQPTGYVYTPSEGQVVDLVYVTLNVISTLYDHCDEATQFLEASSLTDNYASILPEGWLAAPDTTGGTLHTIYVKNFLDQKFNLMRFDPDPKAGAVRTPSSIQYQFLQVGSFQNPVTSRFYGDLTENRQLVLEYSKNRQDPTRVNGWFTLTRLTAFEYEIEVRGQTGGSTTVTQFYYENVSWIVRIEDYSMDIGDQSARLVIDGTFPQRDEEGNRQEPHVAGVIDVDASGRGSGIIALGSEPAFKLNLKGRRGFGFSANFDLLYNK